MANRIKIGEKGFTFAITIIAVVLMGIFASIAIPLASTVIKREKEAELIYRLEKVRLAIANYKIKNSKYPVSLEELAEKKYMRTSSLIDPMTNESWNIAYASLPQSGIKEIHSKNNDIGLKTQTAGKTYSSW